MEKKTELIIRTIIILLGLSIMIYGSLNIYDTLQKEVIPKILINDFNIEYKLSDNAFDITLVIVGFAIFMIGIAWSNIFKSITTTSISFAVLFLTLAITIYPFYSNTENVVNSVQPSIDYIVAGSFDKILLEKIEISNGEKISLIYNEKTNVITIGDINQNDANLMWKELGFKNDVSYETKNFTINLLLTYTSKELKKNNMQNIPIPLNIVGKFLQESNQTKDIKKVIEYDFFNKNITLRAENLNKLRTECENNQIELKELCTPVLMTKYENIMKNASAMQNSQIPLQLTKVLKEIETKEKMQNYIEEKTSSWITFTFIAVILFLIGIISYYLHFKLFNREYKKMEIPYFISKINLINYAPAYILLLVIYFIITGPKLMEIITQLVPKEMIFAIALVFTSPMFYIFMEILKEMMILSTIYFIISIILFVLFYFLLKKENKELKTE